MVTFILVLTLVISIVSIVTARFNKDDEKVDEGFVVFYHKLTYRSKIIRTLWMVPLMIGLFLVIYSKGDINAKYITFGIIIILICIIQVTYNYMQWKRLEKN